jgi:uncharacterized membrane protein AbrB (regulator of aidB expression)
MKSILCLLIAAGFGAVLQSLGVPHGLLLGSILVTALVATKSGFAPVTPYGLGYIQRDGIGHVAQPWRIAAVFDRADYVGRAVADARGRVESH